MAAIADSELRPVAIIPARGGSKRVPRKNIRPFLGVPLIARTIGLIQAANVVGRIVVSTDDEEIAAVARAAGAEVPFVRRAELADDLTGTRDVMRDAIRMLEAESGEPLDAVCSVYPTAVLLDPADLVAAYAVLTETDAEFVVSASTFDSPIQRALAIRADGTCDMVWPEYAETRSQDLDERFHDAGQFYWGRRDAWLGPHGAFSGEARSRLFVVPRTRVQDIDTLEDWERAEQLFALRSER
jgi:N-acylneuraminate cytidylyltransferase